MASGKKNAAGLGAHLVFIDESGFLLIPTVRRTWAPRGVTPVIRRFYRHDRLSVISGISVSPRCRRMGLYFQIYDRNIRRREVCKFLLYLLKQIRGPIFVVWDNVRIHGGAPVEEICRRYPRLTLERFPAYAPELNPDEAVWSHTKRQLANSAAEELVELKTMVRRALRTLRGSQSNLRGCVHASDLPFF